jgi:hypothetical protein
MDRVSTTAANLFYLPVSLQRVQRSSTNFGQLWLRDTDYGTRDLWVLTQTLYPYSFGE